MDVYGIYYFKWRLIRILVAVVAPSCHPLSQVLHAPDAEMEYDEGAIFDNDGAVAAENHEKSRGLNIVVSRTRGASTSMMLLVLTALIGSIAYFVVR